MGRFQPPVALEAHGAAVDVAPGARDLGASLLAHGPVDRGADREEEAVLRIGVRG